MCCVVFVTEPTDKQSMRRRSMEVNAVMPAVPKYMLWSDQEITWSIKDHPRIMPNPGGYALVVDPIMHGPTARVKFSKVLIDVKHVLKQIGRFCYWISAETKLSVPLVVGRIGV